MNFFQLPQPKPDFPPVVCYSLEETYEALRTFQILGLEKVADVSSATCPLVAEKLGSSSSTTKDLFHALQVNSILKCQIGAETIEVVLQVEKRNII